MKFNILMVDDDIDYLRTLAKTIKKSIGDSNIETIASPKEALEKITSNTNLLILNTQMPELDSFELVTKIKENTQTKDIPVMFITATQTDEESIDKAYKIGVIDFLRKPVKTQKIINKIKYYKLLHDKEREIQKERDFMTKVMNSTKCPIFLTDGKKTLFANKTFMEFFGHDDLASFNKSYPNIGEVFIKRDGLIYNNEDNGWIDTFKSQDNNKVAILNQNNEEYVFTIQDTLLKEDGVHVVLLNDITQELQHEKELERLLYIENLTNLPNRTKLIEDLRNKDVGIKSVAIIDINSFKEINDFYGFRTGDKILKGIAQLILEEISKYKELTLYKFPADTYCIANTKSGKRYFTKIVKDIVQTIDKKVFNIYPHEIDTRATAGISFSKKGNKLITADLALQAAKNDHKEYLVFYDELDNLQEYENNMVWAKKLKNAIAKDDMIVYYQPLVNNKTLKVDKYECLVRMIEGDKVVSPFFFLDVSKKSNQYTKLTKIVIEKACKEFENLPFEFSVNVSYEDIEDEDFLPFIREKMALYNVANKIVFEILEDEGIKNYEILINFINEVKALGSKVAIDDFGSGYSNFEHLLKMNIDYLKIDASLIKNIVTDENSYKVTKTIIEFAKNLNMKTIAEYVENKEIFQIVKDLGADYSQGYHFSAPINKPDMYSINK